MKEVIALPGVLSFESADSSLASLWPKIKSAIRVMTIEMLRAVLAVGMKM